MESSSVLESPNTRASMGSTSLESLEISFGRLRVKNGKFEIDGSATAPQAPGNRVSSSLSPNGSSVGVLPGPGLRNRESSLDSSKIGSFGPSFNVMNMNGAGHQSYAFAGNPRIETLNASFSAPCLYNNLASEDSIFNNVMCLGGFSDRNPGIPFRPEAIPTRGNLLGNGLNMGAENSIGFWTQQRINGFALPRSNGVIITLAMTEDGSKYIQNLLLQNDPTIKKLIFEGVIEYIFQLMTNQYGRFLFQKLIELEDENLLRMIMEKLVFSFGAIFNASIDKYGSYSVKKLIKVLEKSPLVTEVVKALCSNFWELMVHPTGKYVIMECLDVVDSQKNDLLYIEAIRNCLQLASDEKGCVSLNSFIIRIKGPRRDQLLNFICDHVVYLAQDPSGNFVVQCVLELHNPAITHKICSRLKGYYVKLSMQKGGSHLAEKCLRSTGMVYVVTNFLQSNQLLLVAKDRYGNFVIQTALEETKKRGSPLHESLLVRLRQHGCSLQHGYGRNILKFLTDDPETSFVSSSFHAK